tara:strand:- start:77 stop:1327 length:1251 start_codon:yes stop_codon:yes gene_type:complete
MPSFNRPLQVYLDSQDYSNMSRAMESADHPHRPIFDKLMSFVDQGQIEIRFSAIHVIESAHLESSSMDLALGRARCIEALARGKCLRSWIDATQDECINAVHGRAVSKGISNDSSAWFPDISGIALGLRKSFVDQINKMMRETPLPRNEKRLLKKRMWAGDQLSPAVVDVLRNGRDELLKSLAQEFPVGERFFKEDLMLKFAAGQVSADVIVEEMSVVLRDLQTFLSWTYEEQDKKRAFVSWLRSGGANLVELIENSRSHLSEINGQLYSLGFDKKEIDRKMRKVYDEAIEQHLQHHRQSYIRSIREKVRKLPRATQGRSTDWDQLEQSPVGTLPMMDAYFLAMGVHFRRSVLMDRKLKDSDSADLYHLACLPYVDLFRADGDTSEVGKPVAELFGKKIVSKLAQLPSEIERSLSS